MAIRHGIWKINTAEKISSQKLTTINIETEALLEKIIANDISILNDDWLLIGQQVYTDFNKKIDLLAINGDGALIIIELKRDRTPREVVAQVLDYASWVETLTISQIEKIYSAYSQENDNLSHAFQKKFNVDIDSQGIKINSSHQMVIVATELDDTTERVVNYLNKNLKDNTIINVLFFSVFNDNNILYLSRSWLIEPEKMQELSNKDNSDNSTWNNEVYCNFGIQENNEGRSWDDAIKYNFVAAGGGLWYSRTLKTLKKGERIWVNIPKHGYVGVGIVEDIPMTINQFLAQENIAKEDLNGIYNYEEDCVDYVDFVAKIKWIHAVPLNNAVVGSFFGNQNSVARPTSSKWKDTVNSLKKRWGIDD